MSLNETPRAERIHIAFLGKRNAGKSSLLNAVTGQDLAVVSVQAGTTTDPVYKSMEILPLGPVVLIDTPGIDDSGELGALRVKKTRQVLNKSDAAVLVAVAGTSLDAEERKLISFFREHNIPWLLAWNKCDLYPQQAAAEGNNELLVSAKTGFHISELKERLAAACLSA
jgi:small GTP-binding protein